MTAITFLVAVLSAVAAIFAVMFFQDRKAAKKYESKAESLSKELNDLRCELARREISGGEAMIPLTRENIAEFLKMKTTGEVDISEDELIKLTDNGIVNLTISTVSDFLSSSCSARLTSERMERVSIGTYSSRQQFRQ